MNVLSLFSGIAGFEVGLVESGLAEPARFCDSWGASQAVLRDRFPGVPVLAGLHAVRSVRDVQLVTAGFPCTDLSQAGRTRGLDGDASGLVLHLLDLVDAAGHRAPSWLLLENVPNMLHLSGGKAMAVITGRLQQAGYRWAYRVVDSRFTGLAQRRRRVILLASRVDDPGPRILGQDRGAPSASTVGDAFGFYWTEGNRGLGWAVGAIPTLKGGTTVSVPSPPAVWLPGARPGHAIVTPSIDAAEVLQGFKPGWTMAAPERDRWKLVGNAVSTRVAHWIGEQLAREAPPTGVWVEQIHFDGARWPNAARWDGTKRWAVGVSEWPTRPPARDRQHLASLLRRYGSQPLSVRATAGFRDRLAASRLRYDAAFMRAIDEHLTWHRAGST